MLAPLLHVVPVTSSIAPAHRIAISLSLCRSACPSRYPLSPPCFLPSFSPSYSRSVSMRAHSLQNTLPRFAVTQASPSNPEVMRLWRSLHKDYTDMKQNRTQNVRHSTTLTRGNANQLKQAGFTDCYCKSCTKTYIQRAKNVLATPTAATLAQDSLHKSTAVLAGQPAASDSVAVGSVPSQEASLSEKGASLKKSLAEIHAGLRFPQPFVNSSSLAPPRDQRTELRAAELRAAKLAKVNAARASTRVCLCAQVPRPPCWPCWSLRAYLSCCIQAASRKQCELPPWVRSTLLAVLTLLRSLELILASGAWTRPCARADVTM